eukprot:TRINITY_DN2605_c1_g1_i2.p1 TRINITY_DN2605_c1_g1~~TRINITY_DN2605_c1_g1_i2.p1  ORF type:complete len:201 (-),score=-7.28 TRINITY_DN2605_c1_g1_i2:148-750(-)
MKLKPNHETSQIQKVVELHLQKKWQDLIKISFTNKNINSQFLFVCLFYVGQRLQIIYLFIQLTIYLSHVKQTNNFSTNQPSLLSSHNKIKHITHHNNKLQVKRSKRKNQIKKIIYKHKYNIKKIVFVYKQNIIFTTIILIILFSRLEIFLKRKKVGQRRQYFLDNIQITQKILESPQNENMKTDFNGFLQCKLIQKNQRT